MEYSETGLVVLDGPPCCGRVHLDVLVEVVVELDVELDVDLVLDGFFRRKLESL